ncbi:MAG TPA: carboxypeptidase-like regulatory domain-containing protein [Candidatus Angelobacter sp.]
MVNKITGAPVRHAQVMCTRVPTDSSSMLGTETDADGHFSISVDAGSYRLWVERSGFAHQVYGSHTPGGAGIVLSVAAGQRVRDVNFRIVPLGAIAGRVMDEEGEPLQGAAVQVLRFSFAGSQRMLIPVSGASSNDRGEYRIYSLPAGRYFLMATPRATQLARPETVALTPEIQEPFAPVYYPGVLDLSAASMITLGAGAELTDADFHMQRVRALTIRGRLYSPVNDFADSQIQVVLARHDDNSASSINRISATVDASSGRFEFRGIAPGPYLLVASQIHDGRILSGRVAIEVTAAAPQENLAVTLSPAFEISGRVEVEGGSSWKLEKATVRLQSRDGLAPGPQPTSKVGADGTVRFTGITAGPWELMFDSLPEDLWIKSVTLGGVDVSSGELNFSAGQRGPLHILLAARGAQVSGSVTRESHAVHATVVLVPAAADLQKLPQLYRSIVTHDDGKFFFKGVSPGAYKLFAFEEVEMFAWLDPDFLKSVESLAEPVSVSEGERVSRQLNSIPAEALLPER